jgi:hypothetical protein
MRTKAISPLRDQDGWMSMAPVVNRRRPRPFAPMIHSDERLPLPEERTKTIRVPSADHAGADSCARSAVNRFAREPSPRAT